ncbi:hypothetical protein Tco_0964658 [Tanacetum coccineum]
MKRSTASKRVMALGNRSEHVVDSFAVNKDKQQKIHESLTTVNLWHQTRIKLKTSALGQLQDGIAEMKIRFADKFQHLENIVTELSDAVLFGKRCKPMVAVLRKAYQAEEEKVTLEIFYEELWSRVSLTDCEDFDEVLSKIQQAGLFQEYQKVIERLGNRVRGWTQKTLVGTFMGGLKPEIADGI